MKVKDFIYRENLYKLSYRREYQENMIENFEFYQKDEGFNRFLLKYKKAGNYKI